MTTLTKQENKLLNKLTYKKRYGGPEGRKKNALRMRVFRAKKKELALKFKGAKLKKQYSTTYNMKTKTNNMKIIKEVGNKFFVRYYDDGFELYTGRDSGGGNYYELPNTKALKQIKTIIKIFGDNSAKPLVELFKKYK